MEQPLSQRFRDCPRCGNPTPAENPDCINCGFRSLGALVAERERAHTLNFVRELFTRRSPFTYLFVGLNLGIFFLMWMAGGMSVTSTDHAVLVGFGAKDNLLIDGQQQYWRFVTCIFIHIGFAHLILNNYALWILGQQIEQIYGTSRFVILYLASGIAGSFASYLFNPEAVSAGASGAIFGLFGAMATFAFRYRKEIPSAIRRDITRRILPIIAINLIYGFLVSIVDNAAHVGGLISGVVLALIVPYKRPGETSTPRIWRVLRVVCAAIISISFIEAFRHYDGPPPRLSNLSESPEARRRQQITKIEEADRLLLESINIFTEAIRERDDKRDVTPALGAAIKGLEYLETFKPTDEPIQLYHGRLVEVLGEQKDLIERYLATSPKNWSQVAAEEQAIVEKAEQFDLLEKTAQ